MGKELHLDVELNLKEALCGGEKLISTIEDRLFKVQLDGVIAPNSRKSFQGEGMPLSKNPKERGDLVLNFKVRFPESLTTEQTIALSKIL